MGNFNRSKLITAAFIIFQLMYINKIRTNLNLHHILHSYSNSSHLSIIPKPMVSLLVPFICAADEVGEYLSIMGTLPLALSCLHHDPPHSILSPRMSLWISIKRTPTWTRSRLLSRWRFDKDDTPTVGTLVSEEQDVYAPEYVFFILPTYHKLTNSSHRYL